MTRTNLQRLEQVRQCLHEDTGDFSAFLEIVNNNSIMYYVGNNLPFSGTYQGKAGFKEFFEKLFQIRIHVVKCQRLTFFGYDTPDGGVVTGGVSQATNIRTGLSCEYEWLSFCTFTPDAKIIKLSTFVDSEPFLKAIEG